MTARTASVLAATLVDRVTADAAMTHLETFQRIADASGGNRAAGTPGHERSAAYAGALLDHAGYRVTYQRFPFTHRETVAERLTRLTPEETDIPVRLMRGSPNTPDGGLTAALAAAAGQGCSAGDYSAAHAGRIALIARGACTFAEKQAAAAAAGAVAALIVNDASGPLTGTLGEAAVPGAIPTAGLARTDGEALAADLAAGQEVLLRLELTELTEERTTVNVLADSPTGDPGRVILAGAHLDSVPEGPGLNDNASGAAGLLATALALAEAGPAADHPHGVRFALWGAEEAGLLGSEHYVRQLSRADRDAIALYLNFDMIASPNGGPFVHDGTGIDPVSAAVTHDVTAFLRDRGDGPELTPFDGRSDYAPFLAAGIPAGGLHTGAEGILTEEQAARWGGTAGAPHDPCYHQACDTLDNIGRDLLATGADVVAHTVGRYAEHLPHTSP